MARYCARQGERRLTQPSCHISQIAHAFFQALPWRVLGAIWAVAQARARRAFGNNGGITRQKQHLTGGFRNSKPCPKCSEHVREEIRNYMAKKKDLKDQMDAIPHFDDIAEEQEQWEAQQQNISYGKRPSSFSVGGGSYQSVAQRMP
ncbi:hypothetical protein Salat_1903400 [Sesamum alatum]|uniref:Uncharacterized protein n=1 Tax=Sesamum alatum TaxID=300844 RepID=A0AAE1Y3N4_9LAMI|nr:hypothetical protein Salat_1903400 [Sesamum alatum]